jgi:hypothetical protein
MLRRQNLEPVPMSQVTGRSSAQTKPWCYWYWISDNISEGRHHPRSRGDGAGRESARRSSATSSRGRAGRESQGAQPRNGGAGRARHPRRRACRRQYRHVQLPGLEPVGRAVDQARTGHALPGVVRNARQRPQALRGKLPAPKEPFQDVAVLAFPAPQHDADSIARVATRYLHAARGQGPKLVDGDLATGFEVSRRGAGRGRIRFIIEFEVSNRSRRARCRWCPATRLSAPMRTAGGGGGRELSDGPPVQVRSLEHGAGCGLHAARAGDGFFSRDDRDASGWCFTKSFGGGGCDWRRSTVRGGAAGSFVEKQLGKMHPTPLPMWDAYLWPTQAEPDSPARRSHREVRDLTSLRRRHADVGRSARRVDYPAHWHDARPACEKCPASPEGQGLEVDKMNRKFAQQHFDAFIGEVLQARMPAPNARHSSAWSPTATRWARRTGPTVSTHRSASATATTRSRGSRC